jgi:hypothetical protein
MSAPGFKVAKLGYSSRPWRIVDPHGNEQSGFVSGTPYAAPISFDSKAEARVWGDLKVRERLGEIVQLERQVPFRLAVNGEHVCKLWREPCNVRNVSAHCVVHRLLAYILGVCPVLKAHC